MTEKKQLLEQARLLEPILRIGKNGITESVIAEIKKQLKNRKLIKIKLIKSIMEGPGKKKTAKEIADATDSELIQQVGFVIVLHKR
jgi:RNA-binding protein